MSDDEDPVLDMLIAVFSGLAVVLGMLIVGWELLT